MPKSLQKSFDLLQATIVIFLIINVVIVVMQVRNRYEATPILIFIWVASYHIVHILNASVEEILDRLPIPTNPKGP
jgi:diacylglycerol kinase